ncbi:MAG: tRNA (N(6)-L-threonylcarbamoyladenosine(37)-C(2))-methylthiotransferase MtaB [Ardenticatenaceae bacterium]|nr:tRNA (N(6)-L-threonylcarbamoyladenosine(37)-C(2))-methylthiotransferase MtaB [Ardenticatenaceae bacterium]
MHSFCANGRFLRYNGRMKVYLHSIGCRLNQSEMETLGRQLLAAGHEIVNDPAQADQVVINTCAVTSEAARDARNITRRIHRDNEAANIFLTGCYATIAPDKLAQIEGASRVVTNQDKSQLLHILDPQARHDLPLYEQEPILREFLAGSSGNTRAFIKVQDGCDNRCTFCVTTIARGDSQSRHLGDIVAEIQALHAAGYREAVLTGVHLGSYGRDLDNHTTLRDLVAAILAYTDIPRLRLSSLEPWDIPTDFFDLWQNPRLLPHLHMPLQAGSDAVLRRMARRTSRASFRALTDAARAAIPHLNLTTDIIVGFPGETEAEFAESVDFVREIGFSRLHVFPYSSRPGTAAARMPHHLPQALKKERARQMIALGQSLSHAFHGGYEGAQMDVLWETAVGAGAPDRHGAALKWVGYTDNYIRVHATGPVNLFNQITSTRLHSARADGMAGEIEYLTSQLPAQ